MNLALNFQRSRFLLQREMSSFILYLVTENLQWMVFNNMFLHVCLSFILCCFLLQPGSTDLGKKFPPKCDFAYRYIQNDHEHNLEMQKI